MKFLIFFVVISVMLVVVGFVGFCKCVMVIEWEIEVVIVIVIVGSVFSGVVFF